MRGSIGVGAKTFARLCRFERLLEGLAAAPLARVAAAVGFADQAHLTHEVRALTGATPAQLRAEIAGGGSMLIEECPIPTRDLSEPGEDFAS